MTQSRESRPITRYWYFTVDEFSHIVSRMVKILMRQFHRTLAARPICSRRQNSLSFEGEHYEAEMSSFDGSVL
jgi:hypothetical protein